MDVVQTLRIAQGVRVDSRSNDVTGGRGQNLGLPQRLSFDSVVDLKWRGGLGQSRAGPNLERTKAAIQPSLNRPFLIKFLFFKKGTWIYCAWLRCLSIPLDKAMTCAHQAERTVVTLKGIGWMFRNN